MWLIIFASLLWSLRKVGLDFYHPFIRIFRGILIKRFFFLQMNLSCEINHTSTWLINLSQESGVLQVKLGKGTGYPRIERQIRPMAEKSQENNKLRKGHREHFSLKQHHSSGEAVKENYISWVGALHIFCQVIFEVYFRGSTHLWFRREMGIQTTDTHLSGCRWVFPVGGSMSLLIPLYQAMPWSLQIGKLITFPADNRSNALWNRFVGNKWTRTAPLGGIRRSAMPEIIPGLREGTRSRVKQGPRESAEFLGWLHHSLCHLEEGIWTADLQKELGKLKWENAFIYWEERCSMDLQGK